MRYQDSIQKAVVTKRGCDKTTVKVKRWLAGAIGGVVMMAGANWASAAGGVSTPDNYFSIGVWSQPAYTFDKWQSRGINNGINYEPYGGAGRHRRLFEYGQTAWGFLGGQARAPSGP